MNKHQASFCTATGILLAALSVQAHPYASGVTNNGGHIQFILNESATDVKVAFDNGGATTDLGPLAKGSNGFTLGAHTNYAITVSKTGSGAFTQISSDSSNAVQFIGPRGVGVNQNPQRPNFGRIYVCSAWPTTATNSTGNGRPVGHGMYLLNADGSDAVGQGNTALVGTMQLGTSYRYSPYRVFVGPDDSVYVADVAGTYTGSLNPATTVSYSPAGAGIWVATPNFSSTSNLFDTTQQGTVFDGVFGLYVTGSLATSNLVVTADEWSLAGSTPGGNFLTPPAVWQYVYDSVTNPAPIASVPYGLMTVGLGINAVLGDMTIHPQTGYIYALQDRTTANGDSSGTGEANNNNASLYIYDSSGVTNLWESGIGGANIFDAGYGIAVSSDGNWMACATGFGTTIIAHITNGIPDLSTMVTNNEEPGVVNTAVLVSQRRGVAFDLADNVITSLPQTPGGGNDAATPTLPSVVREYSLGFSSIATTKNDATATNGSFTLVLLPPAPTITTVSAAGSSVTIQWTSPSTIDTTASFAVQSASKVAGTYADVSPTATVSQPGGAGTAFQATVSASSPATYFRIRHL